MILLDLGDGQGRVGAASSRVARAGSDSVHWGSFARTWANIIRLRVVTMEEEPRVLEFRGEELARVSHAYGTNGNHHRAGVAAGARL